MRRMYPGQIVTLLYNHRSLQLLFTEARQYRWIWQDVIDALEIHKKNLAHLLETVPHDYFSMESVTNHGIANHYKTISREGLIEFLADLKSEDEVFCNLYDWIFDVADKKIRKTEFHSVIGTCHSLSKPNGLTMTKAAGELGCGFTQLRHYLWQQGWITRVTGTGQIADKWSPVKDFIDNGFLTMTVTKLPVITPIGMKWLETRIDEIMCVEASSQIVCTLEERMIISRTQCLVAESTIRTIFAVAGIAWYSVADIHAFINPDMSLADMMRKYCSTVLEAPYGLEGHVHFVKADIATKIVTDLGLDTDQSKELVLFIQEISASAADKKDIRVVDAENCEVIIPLISMDTYQAEIGDVKVIPAYELHEFISPKSGFSTWISNEIESMGLVKNEEYFPIFGEDDSERCVIALHIAIGMAYAVGAINQMRYLAAKAS